MAKADAGLTARSFRRRGMCRQRAGCNPGAAKADGQRAWWQLPPGKRQLECNKRGLWQAKGVLSLKRLKAGKRQARMP